MTPADVITHVKRLLQDNQLLRTSPTYYEATLLGFVNQTLKRMMMLRPDLFTVINDIPTVSGVALQSLPSGAVRLVDIYQVKNSTAIEEVDRDRMNRTDRNWTTVAAGTPSKYMRHPRNPTKFFLYPRPSANVVLTGEYVKSPMTYTTTVQTILELADSYLPVVVDGVMYLAEAIDALNESKPESAKARMYLRAFNAALVVSADTRIITDREDAGIPQQQSTVT